MSGVEVGVEDPPVGVDPDGRLVPLVSLTLALVLGISTWFSATAVVPQLTEAWGLSPTGRAWLTTSVILGFVAGALCSSAWNVSDRIRPQVVMLVGAVGAGVANLGLTWTSGVELGVPLRFATGFFIAGVYPPSFKLIATWYRSGRGMALGVLAAGIIFGNATPHLANALGGVDWKGVIYTTSVMSVVGGLIAASVRDGPFAFPRSVFDPRQVGLVFANRGVRLASIGYFGHMWELFAMAAWFLVFFGDHRLDRGEQALPMAAFVTFMVIAMGAAGSWVGGFIADRWGRTNFTALMLTISGLCSLGIGFLFDGPTWPIIVVGLVWGFTVVADSAQFSAMVTEVGDQSYVGTALTMQIAVGFTISAGTIWVIPIIEGAVTWRWAFAVLAMGPMVGIAAMLRLKHLPEAARIAGGRG
ncbi:MAG TPA: MFS transporter [Actinomycetota bacterium]|jgi:MFS family permease|nr:MFS transporter [Actinomycetota bacterium]